MRRLYRLTAWTLSIVLLIILIGASWLFVSPPSLLRVGSGYAAKIVCSNVFIAGRNADEVLAIDVQAPGHPLLKFMRQQVDYEAKTVSTYLFGLFAPGYAAWHPGFGCSSVPDGDFIAAQQAVSDVPLPVFPPADDRAVWPVGETVQPLDTIQGLLRDKALTGPGMRATVVVRNGNIVGEAYGDGFTAATPLLGWSMTKSVNAALIGRLAQGGIVLRPEMRNLFPEWQNDDRSAITLGQLLGMESGLAFNESYGSATDVTRMLYLEPDMTRYVLSLPLKEKPGEVFTYSSGTSVLLSRLWMSALPGRIAALSYPLRGLFLPLGMRSAVMEPDETGIFVGSSYMYATGRDWARFALFLTNDGVWNGQRLLPEGFVTAMRTATAASGGRYSRMQTWLKGPGPKSDADHGLPEDTFWMLGHDGQSVTIIPSLKLAVIRLGLTPSKLGYEPQPLIRRIIDVLNSPTAF